MIAACEWPIVLESETDQREIVERRACEDAAGAGECQTKVDPAGDFKTGGTCFYKPRELSCRRGRGRDAVGKG